MSLLEPLPLAEAYNELVKWLLESSLDTQFAAVAPPPVLLSLVDASNSDGETEALYAFLQMEQFTSFGSRSTAVFQYACVGGHVCFMRRLLLEMAGERSVDVHVDGERALRLACGSKYTEAVRELLSLEGDLRMDTATHGSAALEAACVTGNLRTVELLLQLPAPRAVTVTSMACLKALHSASSALCMRLLHPSIPWDAERLRMASRKGRLRAHVLAREDCAPHIAAEILWAVWRNLCYSNLPLGLLSTASSAAQLTAPLYRSQQPASHKDTPQASLPNEGTYVPHWDMLNQLAQRAVAGDAFLRPAEAEAFDALGIQSLPQICAATDTRVLRSVPSVWQTEGLVQALVLGWVIRVAALRDCTGRELLQNLAAYRASAPVQEARLHTLCDGIVSAVRQAVWEGGVAGLCARRTLLLHRAFRRQTQGADTTQPTTRIPSG